MKILNRSFFVLLATMFLSLLCFSCSSDDAGLSLSPKSLSYGEVNLGDFKTMDLVIKNKYGKDVIISQLNLTGSTDFEISSGLSLPHTLVNKTEVTITLRFEPSIAGELEGLLSIVHDGSTKPEEVNITGEGVPVPRIRLSETSYDFEWVLISGGSKNHTFDVENIGTADLNLTGLSFTGTDAAAFSFVSGGTVPYAITPGSKHTIEVSFATTTLGNKSAALEIVHDAVNEASPSAITLTGEGIDRMGEIQLSETSPWDFSAIPVPWVIVKALEIENIGIDTLNINSVTLQTGAEFEIEEILDNGSSPVTTPFGIAVGEKATVFVKFAPVASANYNDKLVITHDGTNVASPSELDIEGSGRTLTTKNFIHTGSAQSFSVPAGIYLLKVTSNGAGGGGATGGKGGLIVGFVAVTPGQTYSIIVGGKGNNYTGSNRAANGGGGFSGLLLATAHIITAGGAGGCAGQGGSPYGSGGDGGGATGKNGGNGGCGQGGAGGSAVNTPAGGAGGTSPCPGTAGTALGGGKGGLGISNQAAGGGGGGYGPIAGLGDNYYGTSGRGGFGGGGGGGCGGFGSTNSRMSGGGGGGGGFRGGAGGTAPSGCGSAGGGGGGGGASHAASNVQVITNTQGGGAARGTHGTVRIEY